MSLTDDSGSRFTTGTKVFYSPDSGASLQVGDIQSIKDEKDVKSKMTIKTSKGKHTATAEQVAVYAEKGDELLYSNKQAVLVKITVVSVLKSIWPPSFFIKLEDGLEKDTEATRVFSLDYQAVATARQKRAQAEREAEAAMAALLAEETAEAAQKSKKAPKSPKKKKSQDGDGSSGGSGGGGSGSGSDAAAAAKKKARTAELKAAAAAALAAALADADEQLELAMDTGALAQIVDALKEHGDSATPALATRARRTRDLIKTAQKKAAKKAKKASTSSEPESTAALDDEEVTESLQQKSESVESGQEEEEEEEEEAEEQEEEEEEEEVDEAADVEEGGDVAEPEPAPVAKAAPSPEKSAPRRSRQVGDSDMRQVRRRKGGSTSGGGGGGGGGGSTSSQQEKPYGGKGVADTQGATGTKKKPGIPVHMRDLIVPIVVCSIFIYIVHNYVLTR